MTDNEKKLLIALAMMVRQYLAESGNTVSSGAMSAGEHAIEALDAFGLMVSDQSLIGTWTSEGVKFLEEFVEPWPHGWLSG